MDSTLTKNELASIVAKQAGMPVASAQAAIQASLDEIQRALAAGRKVEFRGFGILKPAVRNARKGRNPSKPEATYDIPQRNIVKFKAGKDLDAALNPVAA